MKGCLYHVRPWICRDNFFFFFGLIEVGRVTVMWVTAFMNWTINGIILKNVAEQVCVYTFISPRLAFCLTVTRKETRTGPTMTHSSTSNLRIAILCMTARHSLLKKFTADYMCRECWTRKHMDNGTFVLWSLCGILKPKLFLGILPWRNTISWILSRYQNCSKFVITIQNKILILLVIKLLNIY